MITTVSAAAFSIQKKFIDQKLNAIKMPRSYDTKFASNEMKKKKKNEKKNDAEKYL